MVGTHLDKCGDTKDDQVLQVEHSIEHGVLNLLGNSKVHHLHRNTRLFHSVSNIVIEGRDEDAVGCCSSVLMAKLHSTKSICYMR